MKIFANFLAFLAVSTSSVMAAENRYLSAMDALSMTQHSPVSLKIERTSDGPKFSEVTANGCEQNNEPFKNNKLFGWAASNQNISKYYTCSDPRKFNLLRFSSSSCQDAIACRKNVAEMQLNAAGSDKLMNEIVAKDYAKNMLAQSAESMDRLEILKKFVQKKYSSKMGESCGARFQPPKKSGICNLNLLDEVFVDQQASCKFGNGCYNKSEVGVLSFNDYKDKEKIAKTAFVVDYNEYRIDEKVKKSVSADSEYVDELAELVVSDEFKNANADQKADMFLKKMEAKSGDRYKDPILAFDFDSVSEKSKLKKMLKFRQLTSIYDNKDLTKESFTAEFENYRKKRAEAVLSESGSCNETSNVEKICKDMTTLSLGKTLPKDSLSVEHLSSRDLKGIKDFEKFKSFMGESFNDADFDMLVNAKRCLSFGLASEQYNEAVTYSGRNPAGSLGAMVGNLAAPSASAVDSSREQLSSFIGDTGSPKGESLKTLEPKMIESESVSDSNTSLESAIANSQAASAANFANQFTPGFVPASYGLGDDKVEKLEKKEESPSVPSTETATNSDDKKLNDLMKRLRSAEKKVEKMKAANEEAEANRVKQKKIDEENALIKELKGQISDLKSAKEKREQKAVAVAAPVVEQARPQTSNVYGSSFNNNGPVTAPSRQEAAPKIADNFDSGRSANSGSSSISSGQRSSMNSAILSASNNNDNNKTLPSGIIVTTIDGMTMEKATQTISNRILELNGTPFYIEEGGMVKEIIAVVKDGKVLLDDKGNPIYEKIVKGKIGDKKFAKAKDKNRAPAAITDAADLKRDQEEKMKRERAEYMKLKNLTNEALNKK